MTISLYQLSTEYQEALNAILDSDFPEDAITDTLEGLKGEVIQKAQNVGAFILNLDLQAGMIESLIERLNGQLEAHIKKRNKLAAYLQENMHRAGITEIKAIDHSFSVKRKLNPEKVEILGDVPDEYMNFPAPVVPTAKPDKAAIKKAIQAGLPINFARLIRDEILVIK